MISIDESVKKAPWYLNALENGFKLTVTMIAGMGLYIWNEVKEAQDRNTEAVVAVGEAVQRLQPELVKQGFQIAALTETMRVLSGRQDTAIETAQRAVLQSGRLERDVELFKYYLLELDAKAIAAGIKPAKEAIATQMANARKRQMKED